MQRVLLSANALLKIPKAFKSSGFYRKKLKASQRDSLNLNDNAFTKNAQSDREASKPAFGTAKTKQKKMNSSQIPPGYFHSKEERSLNNLNNLSEKISGVLQDYYSATTKAELLQKGERLMEAVRHGDFERFFETDKQELADMYSRYDFYKENFVSQVSNNKMKPQEEGKKREEDLFDIKAYYNFEHSVRSRLGYVTQDDNGPFGLDLSYMDANPKTDNPPTEQFQARPLDIRYVPKREKNALKKINKAEASKLASKLATDDNLETQQQAGYQNFQEVAYSANKEKIEREAKVEADVEKIRKLSRQMSNLKAHDSDVFYTSLGNQRVSLRSKLGIYKCYLEGWSIREISIRYGILPNRAKIIVWNMQNFFEEHLPGLNFESLHALLLAETFPQNGIQFVDYGIDLYDYAKSEEGEVFREFGREKLSAYLPTNKEPLLDQETIERTLYKEETKKEDFVLEGYKSKSVRGNKILNWIVYKGKGSLRVNNQFRRIVEGSHRRDYLPNSVQMKLMQGPRIASLGHKVLL